MTLHQLITLDRAFAELAPATEASSIEDQLIAAAGLGGRFHG